MFKKSSRKAVRSKDDNTALNFQIKEASKTARTNLVFSVIKDGCKKIVITSSYNSEGKTTSAVNLAIALAQQMDIRVLLVDCDLRKPKVDRFFSLPAAPGLTNVLGRINELDEVIHKTKVENLEILCSGVIPPNPSELLASEAMKELITKLESNYDYIIFDTPLITDSDGVVLVIREGKSTYPDLNKTLTTLKRIDAKILGLIMNGVEMKTGKEGYLYRYENQV